MNAEAPHVTPAASVAWRPPRRTRVLAALVPVVLLALGLLLGAFSAGFGTVFQERMSLLAALPMALALVFCFFISRNALLMTILFLRALLDPVLSASRMSVGAVPLGLGAIINALILLLVVSLVFDERKPPFKAAMRHWGPFLAAYTVGLLLSPSTSAALRPFLAFLTFPAAFLVGARQAQRTEDFDGLAAFLVASVSLVNLYTLVGLVTHEKLYRVYYLSPEEGLRLAGAFPHPNILAFYLVMSLALSLYVLHRLPQYRHRGWLRALACGVLLSSGGLLLLTQTRSAWAAAYALFLLYAWFVNRRALLPVLVAPLLLLAVPEVRVRLADLQSGNEMAGWTRLNSYAWRELMWRSALSWMSPSHYLLGYGLGSFLRHSATFFPLAGGVAYGAHNLYVQLFFEFGAVGLAAWLWLMGSLLRAAWRMPHGAVRDVVLFLIVMFLIVSWSDNMMDYLVFNVYLFYVLGAGWSIAHATAAQQPARVAGRGKVRRHPPPWSVLQAAPRRR